MTHQKWMGVYSYEVDTADQLPENSTICELHLTIDAENNVSGHLVDGIFHNLTEAHVMVRGFVEDRFVSLVAHFPFKLFRNTNNEWALELEKVDIEVPFYGEISEDGSEMIGTCEQTETNYFTQDTFDDMHKIGFFRVRLDR